MTARHFAELFDAGSGPQRIETAWVFEDLNLVVSVTGATAAIDSWTGVLTIATDRPRAGETVTVVAANSGGATRAALRFTVEAEPVRSRPLRMPRMRPGPSSCEASGAASRGSPARASR